MFVVIDEGAGVTVHKQLTDEEVTELVGSDNVVIAVEGPQAVDSLRIFSYDEDASREEIKPTD